MVSFCAYILLNTSKKPYNITEKINHAHEGFNLDKLGSKAKTRLHKPKTVTNILSRETFSFNQTQEIGKIKRGVDKPMKVAIAKSTDGTALIQKLVAKTRIKARKLCAI